MVAPIGLLPVDFASCPAVHIGTGCIRRDLPSRQGVRVWIVVMAPGAQWPYVDQHDDQGEDVFILSGALIEGKSRFGPGTYLHFGPGSSHRPRTDEGVVLAGFNLLA